MKSIYRGYYIHIDLLSVCMANMSKVTENFLMKSMIKKGVRTEMGFQASMNTE